MYVIEEDLLYQNLYQEENINKEITTVWLGYL